MGINIGYSGSLDDPARLDDAIAMVREFCGKVGWECIDHSEEISGVVLSEGDEPSSGQKEEEEEDEPWPDNPKAGALRIRILKKKPPPLIEDELRGVYVQVPDSESLMLLFNRKGRLRYYLKVREDMVEGAIPGVDHWLGFPNSVKTGGVDAHVGVCSILKMLKARFMSGLDVEDGTGYYDTGNLVKLEAEHALMNMFRGLLSRPAVVSSILEAAGVPKGSKITVLDNKISVPLADKKSKPEKKSIH